MPPCQIEDYLLMRMEIQDWRKKTTTWNTTSAEPMTDHTDLAPEPPWWLQAEQIGRGYNHDGLRDQYPPNVPAWPFWQERMPPSRMTT